MVRGCVIKSCLSESYLDCGISFHRFPKDPNMKRKWMEAIGREITSKDPCVCSKHFRMEDYRMECSLRRLKADVVPTLLLMANDAPVKTEETTSDGFAFEDVEATTWIETVENERPLLACRGCLTASRPLRPLEDTLATVYGELIAINVSPTDILPKFVCSYCRALLLKFKAFRDKCLSVQTAFLQITDSGVPITEDIIASKVTSGPLYPNLQISTVQHSSYIPVPEIISPPLPTTIINANKHKLTKNVPENTSLPSPTTTQYAKKRQLIKNEPIAREESNERTPSANQNQSLRLLVLPDDLKPVIHGLKPAVRKLKPAELDHNYIKPSDEIYSDFENDMPIADIPNLLAKKTRSPKEISEIPLAKKIKFEEREKEAIQNINVEQRSSDCSKNDKNINSVKRCKADRNSRRYHVELYYQRQRDNIAENYNVTYIYLTKEEQIEEVESRKSSEQYKLSIFKCGICYKGFQGKPAYINHMAYHETSHGAEVCDVCQMRFLTQSKLKEHQNITHRFNLVCNECGHVSKTSTAATHHYRKHRGTKYPCKTCGMVFDSRIRMISHAKEAHAGGLACALCDETFLDRNGLRMHMFWEHKEAKDAICDCCNVQFHSHAALQRHRRLAKGCDREIRPCTICGEAFANDELLQEHKQEQHVDNFTCTTCGKTLPNKKKYKKHMSSHYSALRAKWLKERGSTSGNGKKRAPPVFVCDICGVGVKHTRAAFARHRRTHTGEKLFQCPICQKGLSTKQVLEHHVARHRGETKAYACRFCDKVFEYAPNRYRHEKAVHLNIRPFQCETCDKKFQTKIGMQEHVNHIHKNIPWPKRDRKQKRRAAFIKKAYLVVKAERNSSAGED